jgi:hypothetical protein
VFRGSIGIYQSVQTSRIVKKIHKSMHPNVQYILSTGEVKIHWTVGTRSRQQLPCQRDFIHLETILAVSIFFIFLQSI